MPLYEVKLRYVVEETVRIEAPTKAAAITEAWGESDTEWKRIRNFAPKARLVKED